MEKQEMKVWKYVCILQAFKCRPCSYISEYIEAADFWDANKKVHDIFKNSPARVLECKITEVK